MAVALESWLRSLPADPFALAPLNSFRPAQRRHLHLLGAGIELLWLPERRARQGIPTVARPPFRKSEVERILEQEALWRADGMVITANRFPFANQQLVLWSEQPMREVTLGMLELGIALETKVGGTLLLNTIGAAASIARAHMHLLGDCSKFLAEMPTHEVRLEYLDASDVSVVQITAPFPVLVLGLRGSVSARAKATHRLLEIRTSPAVNLVSSLGTTWVIPRGPVEIPKPHFPHALGAAELWGRWCYGELSDFEAATPAQLEQALCTSCYWNQGPDHCSAAPVLSPDGSSA